MNIDDTRTEPETEQLDAVGEPLTTEQRTFLADLTAMQARQRAARLDELERRAAGLDPLPGVDTDPTPPHGTQRPHNVDGEPGGTTAPADAVGRSWVPCGTCHGHGALVVSDLTAQLRAQGQPFTVTAPCPICRGGGGS